MPNGDEEAGPEREREQEREQAPGARDAGTPDGILGVTVRRPIGVLMVLLAIVLFGMQSFGRLPVNLLPDLSFPTLTVRTTWDGAAPEEIEDRVTRPLEEALRMVPGLSEARSTSRAGMASTRLRFVWGTDMRMAAQDVAERVQQARNELPEDADAPLILRYDPTLEPVLRFAVKGRRPAAELRRYAEEELSRAIEKLEGVAAAKVRGGVEQEVHIDLREDLLAAENLTVRQVSQRLQEENVDVAAGSLTEGDTEYLVRTRNRLRTLEELEQLIVAERGAAVVRLRDVGEVTLGGRERDAILRVDGDEAVVIEVYREAGANLVAVAERVRQKVLGTEVQRSYVVEHRARLASERAGTGAVKPEKAAAKRGGGKRGGGRRRGRRGGMRGGMGGRGGSGRRDDPGRRDREMTDYLAYRAPDGIEVLTLEDRAVFVRDALSEVNRAVLLGGLLAVLVLFVFLRRLRPTAIIAVSLPASVVFTFAAMFAFGVSLNLMSLGGLALGVGMLVDNSIVVLESIVRCREAGDGLIRATMRGTRQVAGAVTASTLTTVAVFLPIVFVDGVAGQIFGDQAMTVVLSLVASLVAALFLIPMLQSRRVAAGAQDRESDAGREPIWRFPGTRRRAREVIRGRWWVRPVSLVALPLAAAFELLGVVGRGALWLGVQVVGRIAVGGAERGVALILRPLTWPFDRVYRGVERLHRVLLDGALARPGLTLALVGAGCVYAALLYPRLGAELIPRMHQGVFTAEVSLPVTTPVEATDRVLTRVVGAVRSVEGVARVWSRAGVARDDVEAADEGPFTGRLHVELEERFRDAAGEEVVLRAVREVLANFPELGAPRITFPELVSLKSTLDVEITEDDLPRLREQARQVEAVLAAVPGLLDVSAGLEQKTPEIVLDLNPEQLARHGLTRRQVAEAVRAKVQGERPTPFRGRRRLEIRVGLRKADLQGVEALKRLRVDQGQAAAPGSVAPVPVLLGDIAKIRIEDGPSEIERIQGRRIQRVTANLAEGVDLQTATARAEAALASALGPLVDARVVGESEQLSESLRSMLRALLTAAFLVYVVMASQFESFIQPLLIVLSLPLALIGVLTALYAAGQPLGVVVYLGAIVLAGIVVNNAIVLIDTTNQLRAEGRSAVDAVRAASRLRLRPILMTTATTVLGLLPMLLASGSGSEIRRPLALTVTAGLMSATFLTLLVIPVCYALVEAWLERVRGNRVPGRSAPVLTSTDGDPGGEGER